MPDLLDSSNSGSPEVAQIEVARTGSSLVPETGSLLVGQTGSSVVLGLSIGLGICIVFLLGAAFFAYLLYRVPG